MKFAGEPSTGNLYTRFDEGRGGLAFRLAPSSTLLAKHPFPSCASMFHLFGRKILFAKRSCSGKAGSSDQRERCLILFLNIVTRCLRQQDGAVLQEKLRIKNPVRVSDPVPAKPDQAQRCSKHSRITSVWFIHMDVEDAQDWRPLTLSCLSCPSCPSMFIPVFVRRCHSSPSCTPVRDLRFDPNGTKLSVVVEADGIGASRGHAVEK